MWRGTTLLKKYIIFWDLKVVFENLHKAGADKVFIQIEVRLAHPSSYQVEKGDSKSQFWMLALMFSNNLWIRITPAFAIMSVNVTLRNNVH